MNRIFFPLALLLILNSHYLFSQEKVKNNFGIVFKYGSSFAPFPHQKRSEGYTYGEKYYSAEDHYRDSTVLLFVPDYLKTEDTLDLVFYFHGWRNNIDSSVSQFKLPEQFYKSGEKGIFVFPEGARNSPDSYGGKLEEKNVFMNLVFEIKNCLRLNLGYEPIFGNISLAGHSGAYRVISYILLHGGMTPDIKAVYLFDGLYGGAEKFSYWIDNYNGKFINIYTPQGGTVHESENLMLFLDGWGIEYKLIENDNFSSNDLSVPRIIFIKSKLDHNGVIHTLQQFRKFLESSL